jgi:hypothetical protein
MHVTIVRSVAYTFSSTKKLQSWCDKNGYILTVTDNLATPWTHVIWRDTVIGDFQNRNLSGYVFTPIHNSSIEKST